MLNAGNRRRFDNPEGADSGDTQCLASAFRIRIGVVENDNLLCEGLVALVNTVEAFECIGAWTQVQEALLALQGLRPDVLLLDIRQLQPSGLTLFQRLLSLSPATRVLLTMNDPEEWWMALDAHTLSSQRSAPVLPFGVCGMVCKARGFRGIAESICRAYVGEHEVEPSLIVRQTESSLPTRQLGTTTEDVPTDSLTLREWQVIHLIGQGHSNKDIARETQLGYSTVKNYVSSIMKKLHLAGRTQIALFAHQRYSDPRHALHFKQK